MKKLSTFLFLLLLNCGGSKEFDELPTPIGGDIKVQEILVQALGSDYYNLASANDFLIFGIGINEDGKVTLVSLATATKYTELNSKIKRAMMDHIKFTPATKNGKRVKASFQYVFHF